MNSDKKKKKFPKGTWLVMGTSVGVIFVAVTENIVVGSVIGITLGVVFEYFFGSFFKEKL